MVLDGHVNIYLTSLSIVFFQIVLWPYIYTFGQFFLHTCISIICLTTIFCWPTKTLFGQTPPSPLWNDHSGQKKTQSGAYVRVCVCSSWIQNLILHHHHVEWTRTHNVCPVLLVGWMNLTYNNNILGRITTTPTPYVFS